MNTFKKISGNSKWLFLLTLALCVCEKLPDYCGDAQSFNFKTEACCGGNVYNPSEFNCVGGVLKSKTATSNTYTIMFDINYSDGGNPPNATTNTNGTLSSLPTPSRTGYTFEGWYTAITGGIKVTTGTIFTENTIIYARWTKNATTVTYTITFDINYSDGSNPPNATTNTNGTLSSLPTPSRTGYTLDGWYTATTGGTLVTTSTVFSADTTIYAQWTGDGAHVRFTWETNMQPYIQYIAASYSDVDYWYKEIYYRPDYRDYDATSIPMYDGSMELPNNIYSKNLNINYKNKYFPISKGKYTAVCVIEDEYGLIDIVANYIIAVYESYKYFDVGFDVRNIVNDDYDYNWEADGWFYDVYNYSDTEPYLQKTPAKKGLVKTIETDNVTYYVFRRPTR